MVIVTHIDRERTSVRALRVLFPELLKVPPVCPETLFVESAEEVATKLEQNFKEVLHG